MDCDLCHSHRQKHAVRLRQPGSGDIRTLWIAAGGEFGVGEVLPEHNFPSIIASRLMFKAAEAQLTIKHPFVLSFIMVVPNLH